MNTTYTLDPNLHTPIPTRKQNNPTFKVNFLNLGEHNKEVVEKLTTILDYIVYNTHNFHASFNTVGLMHSKTDYHLQYAVLLAHKQELVMSGYAHPKHLDTLALYLQGEPDCIDFDNLEGDVAVGYTGGKESENVKFILDCLNVPYTLMNIHDNWHTRQYASLEEYLEKGALKDYVVASLDSCEITPTFNYGDFVGQSGKVDKEFGFGLPVPIAVIQRMILLIHAVSHDYKYLLVGDELERQQVFMKDGCMVMGHDYYQSMWFYSLLNTVIANLYPKDVKPLKILSLVRHLPQKELIDNLDMEQLPFNSCVNIEFGECGECYACRRINAIRENDVCVYRDLTTTGYRSWANGLTPIFEPSVLANNFLPLNNVG